MYIYVYHMEGGGTRQYTYVYPFTLLMNMSCVHSSAASHFSHTLTLISFSRGVSIRIRPSRDALYMCLKISN